MNRNLDLARKTRELLENLYTIYGGAASGGDLLMIDELDGTLYKGKDLHYNQSLICFKNEEIVVKINGSIENENLANQSSVKLSKTEEEVSFYNLEENSEEYLLLLELDKNINNVINPKNTKEL